MKFLLIILSAIYFYCAVNVAAQAIPGPTWSFPLRLTLEDGTGATEPSISFVRDTLYPTLDVTASFTILGWLNASNPTTDWRTFVSIESSACDTSLFNVALVPNGLQIYFAYMTSNNDQGRDAVVTPITAPGPNVDFHFAIVKDSTQFYIYINGVKQPFTYTIKGQIFNPATTIDVVIGRTKFQNVGQAQWDGMIRGMDIFNRTLTTAEIQSEMTFTNGEI